MPSEPPSHASTLAWLLGMPQPQPSPLQANEAALLELVHAVLRQRELPAGLVPRAAAVIPQLLRLLRHQSSRQEIVERITKDMVLTAEVLRIAQSPYYRTKGEVDSLDKAVMIIGINGVQAAIARVVLKPMYDSSSGGLTAQAAARGWQYSERQADCCADLTVQSGLERYEGFLAGTLHGIGRTALLRVLDRAGICPAWPCSQALDEALTVCSNQLFGRYIADMHLTPALTEAGQSLAQDGRAGPAGSLPWLLRESERLSTLSLLAQPIEA
ncbi:MAG TPA: HDOD domain-containing protein [Macromonas sp.]|nr:HDOD domain-containing protein [Macromonas sp.]